MKRKLYVAIALMLAVSAGTACTFTSTAIAQEITKAKAPTDVKYGKLTKKQLEIVNKCFDAKYYASENEDVVAALGSDEATLLKHFVNCGIFEGRQGWASFNPAVYASAYSDLKAKYGKDVVKYYEHYYTFGAKEGRTITTIDACKSNGVKLVSFFSEEDLLSTSIYAAANLMGTSDYSAVSNATSAASSTGAATVSTSTGNYVIEKTPAKKAEETKQPTVDVPVVEEPKNDEPATTEPAVDEPVVDESKYEKVGVLQIANDPETVIIIYRLKDEYNFDYTEDLNTYTEDSTLGKVIGQIPMVAKTVEQGNSVIDDEDYEIPHFETEKGVIVGTEAVKTDETGKQEYVIADDFEGPHAKRMINYLDGKYQENAVVSIDEKGDENTEYEISAKGKKTEDGDDQISVKFSNEENNFEYTVNYTFKNDSKEVVSEESKEAPASNNSGEAVSEELPAEETVVEAE